VIDHSEQIGSGLPNDIVKTMQVKNSPWCLIIALGFCGYVDGQQPWSGVISSQRAANWSTAGIPGGIPSGSWTQCGATVAAYGASGSPASPSTINTAISGCASNHYVLLGNGDFYLNGSISLASNVVLRGGGANNTRLHFSASTSCNGYSSATCLVGSVTYSGSCKVDQWPCPSGQFNGGYQHTANWIAGYSQGATTITLDSVTGIVANVTPIVLDQCDVGYTGTTNTESCIATSGVITAANVYAGLGGSGYAVNDTGTIGPSVTFGRGYGSGTATYKVTSVSGGAVTGISVANGGSGYTYTDTGYFASPTATTATSGSGTGLAIQITAITGYDNSGLFICAVAMVCSNLSDAGSSRVARSQSETVLATAISGTGPFTVTLNRPLIHPNWASGQGPQAWWGSSTLTNAGIENLTLDMSAIGSGASAVAIQAASNVWVKGIASNTANFFHVLAVVACNFVVRDSYFYYTTNQSTTSYGIGSGGEVSAALFENNILQGIVDPLNPDASCTGCVFDYNYSINQADTATNVMFASSPMHAAGTDYILEEGNIGSGTNLDNTHGPHFLNTFYRNYFNGYEANNGNAVNNSTTPVTVGSFSRYNNFVANVLGTPGYHTVYQCVPSSSTQQYCSTDAGSGPGYVHIWSAGFSGDTAQRDFTNSPFELNDTLTVSSFMRWGNWDTVRGAVSWCGNSSDTGWSTTCAIGTVGSVSTSEVPTGDPNFPNSIPTLGDTGAGQGALPPSFLYSSVPSWWPSGKAWPPIGPDVTTGNIGQCTGAYTFSKALSGGSCTGGSLLSASSTNAAHAVSIPAMDCYLNTMGGTPNGTGSFLSFNASVCYPQSGSGSGSPPNSPIVVSVTVN
jgi:hypothetical protein